MVRVRYFQGMGWALAWLVLGAISVNFLSTVYGKYHQLDEAAYGMFWTRQHWLWTHLTGGVLTVVLGPVQFLTRWPKAWPRVHRWVGRVYVGGIVVGLVGAVGLISTSPAPDEIRIAFASTALAWFTTGSIALIAIYRGRVQTHRRWMVRNYLVTLAPISFRLALPACIALGIGPSPGVIAALLWGSWLVPLLVYQAIRIIGLLRSASSKDGKPSQRGL